MAARRLRRRTGFEAAAEPNPNLAVVYCGLGDSLAYERRVGESIPQSQRDIDLSPHDPLRWAFYSDGALAELLKVKPDFSRKLARRRLFS